MAASDLQEWLIKYIQESTNQDNVASSFVDSDELELVLAKLDQDVRCDLITTVRSQEDKTALDYAVECGHQDIVRAMLKGLSWGNHQRLLWMSKHACSFTTPYWMFRGYKYITDDTGDTGSFQRLILRDLLLPAVLYVCGYNLTSL